MTDTKFTHPFDEAHGKDAVRLAAALQHGSENQVREAARTLAQAEHDYRLALSLEIFRLHQEEKVAWTACDILARGQKPVADLRLKRDIAAGVHEAAQQEAWRRTADRRDVSKFIDWSMRKDIGSSYGQGPDAPDEPITFGKRAA